MSSGQMNGAGAGSAQPGPPPRKLSEKQQYLKDMQYKTAVACVVVAPILIFSPPRRMNFMTFGLGCLTAFCTDHIMLEHGHPGLLYAVTPGFMMSSPDPTKPPEHHMLPSQYIWKQMTDVWNQRSDEEEVSEEDADKAPLTMLERIRMEEGKKGDSELLRMLEEIEQKKKKREEQEAARD
ncbi:hypothetical protein DRE_04276 [Drechslerella stenobrocha 248]|uniref:Uncharacterized protein n=1 Tax=Drechslerella stenobrocha 248 TaxID=1043628 RepID=W7I321_9PEZI|nr:hypothetical protein DRE_04276 [Drechslerella stenobrocha 248]